MILGEHFGKALCLLRIAAVGEGMMHEEGVVRPCTHALVRSTGRFSESHSQLLDDCDFPADQVLAEEGRNDGPARALAWA
jgi:hypothetical protein